MHKNQKHFTDITDHWLLFRYRRAFHVWINMIGRCEKPNWKTYKNWGGRGIKVCPEWHDMRTFCDWMIEQGYGLDWNRSSLDRIDNDGDYCPENCRLTTHQEQSANRRMCRKYRDRYPEYTEILRRRLHPELYKKEVG